MTGAACGCSRPVMALAVQPHANAAGTPGACTYQAVDTHDALVGCWNERYIRFGWASARLGTADIVRVAVPARAELDRLEAALHATLADRG